MRIGNAPFRVLSASRNGRLVVALATTFAFAANAIAQGGFIEPSRTGIGAIPKKLIHGNGPFEFTPPEGLKLPGTLGDPTLFDVPPTFDLPPSGTTPVLLDGSGLSFGFGGGLIDGGVPLIPGPGMPAAGLLALLHLISRRRRG